MKRSASAATPSWRRSSAWWKRRKAAKRRFKRLPTASPPYFVPLVMALAIITLVGWLTIGGADLPTAVLNMIAVLVIACPCALGLATPTAIMVGSGRGAESGILFRSSEALERAAALSAVLLDKTGTVTQGKPSVTALVAAPESDEHSLLQFSASAENLSEHPLASAVVAAAKARGINLLPVDSFEAHPGRGLSATVAERALSHRQPEIPAGPRHRPRAPRARHQPHAGARA